MNWKGLPLSLIHIYQAPAAADEISAAAPTIGLIDILALCEKIEQSGAFSLYANWLHPAISGKFTDIGIAIPGGEGVLVAPECLDALRGVLEDPNISKRCV